MRIETMFDEKGRSLATDVWITKKRIYRYISLEKEDEICPICEEKHKLKAHHIVPKRLKTKSKQLKELRIRICDGCHTKIHPENVLIIGMRKLVEVIDDLTEGNADKIDAVKEFKECAYNRKIEDGVLYNHLEKINKNLERGKCL